VIGFVRGEVAGRTVDWCFIDVAGVGYRLTCSATTLGALPPAGAATRLWTHLHVRDDALALYGFATEAEQAMFEGLLGVAGIGPKVALALCSSFSPDAFRRALVSDDAAAIASVPGVGRKTAQRVLVDLKDRLGARDLEVVGSQPEALARARSALENLGYTPAEVRAALGEVAIAVDDSVEDVVRSALRLLA
jgi:Holliday junction DNA helicase RuvA